MNHQRFKFYKHSTEYYRSLYNTVTELEDKDIVPVITQYPSTINRKRRSTFVKKCKSIQRKCRETHTSHTHSQSVSCDSSDLSEIPHISTQSHDKML